MASSGPSALRPSGKSKPLATQNPFEALPPVNDDEVLDEGDDNTGGGVGLTYDQREDVLLSERETATRRIVKTENLPDYMKWTEVGCEYDTAGETFGITGHYEGRDQPPASVMKAPDRRAHGLDDRVQVALLFHDYTVGENRDIVTLGSVLGAAGNNVFITQTWNLNSNCPAIVLTVSATGHPEVTCTIAADALWRDSEHSKPSIQLRWGRNQTIRDDANRTYAQLRQHARDDNILTIDLDLWQMEPDVMPMGPEFNRPRFTGLTSEELTDLENRWLADPSALDQWGQTIGYLRNFENLSIFRFWRSAGAQGAAHFANWIINAFNLTAKYEEWWFYRSQLDNYGTHESIFDPQTDIGALAPARNQIKTWMCDFNALGRMIKKVPHQIVPFSFGQGSFCFSSPKTLAFGLRMGVERSRQFQTRILTASFQDNDFDIIGEFQKHPHRPGFYVVDLRLGFEGTLLAAESSLRPKPDTKLNLSIRCVDVDHDFPGDSVDAEIVTYGGVISEDLFGSKAEVSCIVQASEGAFLESKVVGFKDGFRCRVKVDLIDDPTPASRQRGAIETLQEPLERTTGVDLPLIVLRAPPTVARPGSLASQISPGQLEQVLATLKTVLSLNDGQMQALRNSGTSKSGFTLIRGPPVTGKSYNSASAAAMHVLIGKELAPQQRRPVLACAPSNVATEVLLKHFLDITKLLGVSLEIVRYKGSLLKEDRTKQPAEAMEVDEGAGSTEEKDRAQELKEALWDLADDSRPFDRDEEYAEYGFHVQRRRKFAAWAGSPSHPLRKKAKDYSDALVKIKSPPPGLSKQDKKTNRAIFNELEEDLTEYYLENEVDIVFATNSSSAHGVLRGSFHPKVLVSDEIASTSLPDASTPAASFKEDIEHWIIAGDHSQQKPQVSSKGRNEFSPLLELSLFEVMYTSKLISGHVVELVEQRRMHPELSLPLGTIWYPQKGVSPRQSSLIDHPSTHGPSAVWDTLKEFLSVGLGAAFNGRRRVALDISGTVSDTPGATEKVQSTKAGGTSLKNVVEAEYVAQFIKMAIAYSHSIGRPLTVADFMVLSPYRAQCQEIISCLFRNGVNQKGARVKVATTRVIQGSDANIVLASMTRCVPDKALNLGFIAESGAQCVTNSRAKQALIFFGPILPWLGVQAKGHRLLSPEDSKLKEFAQLLADINEKRDVVAFEDVRNWLTNGMSDGYKAPTVAAFKGMVPAASTGRAGQGQQLNVMSFREKTDNKQKKLQWKTPSSASGPSKPSERSLASKAAQNDPSNRVSEQEQGKKKKANRKRGKKKPSKGPSAADADDDDEDDDNDTPAGHVDETMEG